MHIFFLRLPSIILIFFCAYAYAGDPPPDGQVYGPTPAPEITELPDTDDPANNGFITLHEVWQLHAFGKDPKSPVWPKGQIVQDPQGNIYGAAPWGGEFGKGAIFKVSPDGQFQILHAFTGEGEDGVSPRGGLTWGPDGMLYGTTNVGGKFTVGSIFKISPQGGRAQTIWSFRNGWLRKLEPGEKKHSEKEILDSKASFPEAPLVLFNNKLYGVAMYTHQQRIGMLFETGTSADSYNALHHFNHEHEGRFPMMLAVCGGELYGITYAGTADMPHGTIFAGPGATVIHKFSFDDGAGPVSLICGKDGDLYGTTEMGGIRRNRGYGTIFKVDLPSRKFQLLHVFDKATGIKPTGNLTESTVEPDFLYGTAYGSVTRRDAGPNGIIYRIRKTGKDYAIVHKFSRYKDGHGPFGGLLQMTTSPAICGTTLEGGSPHNYGSVYCMQKCRSYHTVTKSNPGIRICCALGTNGALMPDELTGHEYGGDEPGEGNDGYFYSETAGLMDLGHMRDLADMTYFIYESLTKNFHCVNLYEGFVQVKDIPADNKQRLALAGAIAYFEAWAHELSTWRRGTVPHLSSFSPEDMTSNMAGIELGKRAISAIGFKLDHAAYNGAVDKEMGHTQLDPELMVNELSPMSETDTINVLDELEGPDRWFTGSLNWTDLKYRNFSGLPWKVGFKFDKQKVFPYIHPATYEKNSHQFDYIMKNKVIGKEKFGYPTENNIKEIIKELEKEYEVEFPGKTKWQGIPPMVQ